MQNTPSTKTELVNELDSLRQQLAEMTRQYEVRQPDQQRASLPGEELFEAFLNVAPNGILVADNRGIITLANRQVEAMFDYDRGQLIGKPVEMLVSEDLREVHAGH